MSIFGLWNYRPDLGVSRLVIIRMEITFYGDYLFACFYEGEKWKIEAAR